MSPTTTTITSSSVFELVRYVDGKAVPYEPYRSDCAGCCSTKVAAAAPRSCCSGH